MLALWSTRNNTSRQVHQAPALSATSYSFVLSRRWTWHTIHNSHCIVFLQILQKTVKGEGEQTHLHLLHGLDADPTALPSLCQLVLEWVHQDDGAQAWCFFPLHMVKEYPGFFRLVTNDCGNVSCKKISQTSWFCSKSFLMQDWLIANAVSVLIVTPATPEIPAYNTCTSLENWGKNAILANLNQCQSCSWHLRLFWDSVQNIKIGPYMD